MSYVRVGYNGLATRKCAFADSKLAKMTLWICMWQLLINSYQDFPLAKIIPCKSKQIKTL